LLCIDNAVRLTVDGYYPRKKSAPTNHRRRVARGRVRKSARGMKLKQRECIQFGNLVMEGRDIGSNVFPETDFQVLSRCGVEDAPGGAPTKGE